MCTPMKSIPGIVMNKLEIKFYFEDTLDFFIDNNKKRRSFNMLSKRETSNPALMRTNNQFEVKGWKKIKNFLWKLRATVITHINNFIKFESR